MALKITRLSLERNEKLLFEDMTVDVHPGELLHIKGANGVGKTSLLRTLCGLTPMTSGEIAWQGNPIYQHRDYYLRDLIYIGHQLGIKNSLTVYENIQLWMSLQKQPLKMNCESALLQAGLLSYKNIFAQQLSAGLKQRLALIKLALFKAPLWVIDEPFTALDTIGVEWVNNLLQQHLTQQGLVIMTSHQTLMFNQIQIKEIHLV